MNNGKPGTLALATAMTMIIVMILIAGCGDDDESSGGTGVPNPGNCADIDGTWSMALQVEDGWFGPVLSSLVELVQSDTCTVTGTMMLGPELEGYCTRDSFFFSYGEPDALPEDRVYCALEIVDGYLMEGKYMSLGGSGLMTMHGPDPDCSGMVELEVSSGLAPTFSWEPDCDVSLLIVEPVSSGEDQWLVGNENENALPSGIEYGEPPPGVNSREVVPLVAGTTYEVVLYKWLGEDDAYLMAGYAVFTP